LPFLKTQNQEEVNAEMLEAMDLVIRFYSKEKSYGKQMNA
jgi:hypothetical protein